MTTWLEPLVATLVSGPPSAFQIALRSIALSFFIALNVYATSCALNGWPSLHLAPSRIVKVSVLKLLDHAAEVASHGFGLLVLWRMFTNCSGSYTKPNEVSVTAGLNGLNWQVQVDPLSLSMTSLPPTLPVFAGAAAAFVDEAFVEVV